MAPFADTSQVLEFLLTMLAVGLVLFAVMAAVAFVVVRAVFMRMAGRLPARFTRRIDQRTFLARLDRTERLMDRRISLPLVGGIGLDAVLGFVPYVGDSVSALVTGALILDSIRYGVPKAVVARMVTNMFIDLLGGAIPIVGDVFDIVFKANTRNIALVRAHLAKEAAASGADPGR